MSATAAIPDQAATPPVNSAEESELDRYFAELEDRGEDVDVDEASVTPPVASSTDTNATTTAAIASSTEAPTDAPVAQAPAPAPTPTPAPSWRDEIDTNPNLPKHLQNKTRGEVYDANIRAEWRAMEAGRLKNDAERELLVTKGLLTALRSTAPAPTPAPTPTPAPIPGHKAFGLDSSESAFGAVDKVVDQLPGYIDHQIEQRASQLANQRIAPLEKTLGDMQQQAVIAQAESARLNVRNNLKIDPEAFEGVTPALKTYLYLNNLDPRVEQNWEAAFLDLRSKAARIVPQTAAITTAAPPAGSATSTAAAPVAPRRAVTTGDKKADAMIASQLVNFFGHTRGTAKFDEAFKKAVDAIRAEKRGLTED